MLTDHKICFIGAGAMAEAVLAGMLNKHIVKPGAVSITNRSDRFRLEELGYNFGVVAKMDQKETSIREATILILAMKPKDVWTALESIRHLTNPNQIIISMLAGISTAHISSLLGHDAPVIRSMPNTSATIGMSATGLSRGATATEHHLVLAQHIFESIGKVAVVEEHQLDAVTGLSGSGPAYIYYLVEAMQAGAVDVGLNEQMAKELILQTLIGAANMLLETKEDPAVLRQKVTSPNGTTQAGLDTLRSYQFEEALRACIKRATERSKELGAMLSESKS